MDRRKFLARAGLVTAGGAAGAGAGFAAGMLTSAREPTLTPTARTAVPPGPGSYAATVTFRTAASAKLIALTIDDGPTPEWTPQLLRILQRYEAKATFFRVGERAREAPELVAQTADAGHEQGNHTWAHNDLTQHDWAFVVATLERTHALLAKLTGQTPTLCRPPYGRVDSVGLEVCASLHYGVTLWSHHVTGSYAETDVDAILRHAAPGSIILAHDGGSEPNPSLITQLDRLLASMTNQGFRFVTVGDLLAASA